MYQIIWMYSSKDESVVSYAVLRESNKLSQAGITLNCTFNITVYDIKNGKRIRRIKGTTLEHRIDFEHPFILFSK